MTDLRTRAMEGARELRDLVPLVTTRPDNGIGRVLAFLFPFLRAQLDAKATLLEELAAALPEWRPISEAPRDGTRILLLLESGGVIAGEWVENAGVTSEDTPCGMWGASNEEIWPTSWTDGLCWASNADEVSSDQPIAWSPMPLPAPPPPSDKKDDAR